MDGYHDEIGAPSDQATVADGADSAEFGDDWVHELIAMTRPGVEIHVPRRGLRDRIMPFEFDDFD